MSQSTKYIIYCLVVLAFLFTFKMYDKEHKALLAEQLAHKSDVQHFKDVQADANRKAEDTKNKLTREAKANAKQADQNYSDLLSRYRANLVRYKANQGGGSGPDHRENPPAQSGDGPGESSDVLAITKDDADICAVNTARLQAVHDWAIKQEQVDANP
jgi:hypothetical protein